MAEFVNLNYEEFLTTEEYAFLQNILSKNHKFASLKHFTICAIKEQLKKEKKEDEKHAGGKE